MISIEEIKSIIIDRENEINEKLNQEFIIDREHKEYVKNLLSTDSALIISGVRRCGKSILAYTLGKNLQYGYVNFEDERLNIKAFELNKVIEAVYSLKENVELFIFDEIQNIQGWEKFITRLITNKKVIITGSNAKLLSCELATHLTGRHIDFILFPFSFNEYLRYNKIEPNVYLTEDIADVKNHLKIYMEKGGLPLSYKLGRIFLAETFKDIIERDISQRYNIRYIALLKDLAKYLINNFSKEITFNKLKNIINIKSVHTIINYVEYIKNSYLIFVLERFSYKLKERMLAPKKVYCIDTGFINSIGFNLTLNFGRILENMIAIELLREQSQSREVNIFYYKDYNQHEVDFVVEKNNKVIKLIQVCCDINDDSVFRRETRSLEKAGKELRCSDLTIITWDQESTHIDNKQKIKLVPAWKWLVMRPKTD